MKIILILFGVLLLVFIGIQLYAMSARTNIESYPYQVVKSYKEFEIRNYEASLFTTVKLSTNDYKKASSQGFSILAGYIFGGNKTNEKISMTSPVAMSLEDSMTMMFMVPKALKKENLPEPNQNEIKFREVPAKTVAAISFGGWADSEKIEFYKNKLIASLNAENIDFTDRFFFLGYNTPFDLVNRKNEVIVELKTVLNAPQ